MQAEKGHENNRKGAKKVHENNREGAKNSGGKIAGLLPATGKRQVGGSRGMNTQV